MVKIDQRPYLQQKKKRNIVAYYILILMLEIFLEVFLELFEIFKRNQGKYLYVQGVKLSYRAYMPYRCAMHRIEKRKK